MYEKYLTLLPNSKERETVTQKITELRQWIADNPVDSPVVMENTKLESVNVETKQIDEDTGQTDEVTKQANVDTKQTNVDTKQADVGTTQTDVDTKQADVDTKQTDVDTKQTDVDTKQTDVDTKQTDVDTKQETAGRIDFKSKAAEKKLKNKDLKNDLSYRYFRFGLKQGLNISELDMTNTEGFSSNYSYSAGIMFEFGIARLLSIQPEILLSPKGSHNKTEAYSDLVVTYNFLYAEIPVYLVFKTPIGFNFGAGIYAAYMLGGKGQYAYYRDGHFDYAEDHWNLLKEENRTFDSFDWGVNFMAEYQMSSGLVIGASYTKGMKNIMLKNIIPNMPNLEAGSAKNSNINIYLGVKF
jgi:hypothetical protein